MDFLLIKIFFQMLSILSLFLLGLILPVLCSITSLPLPEEDTKCVEGCFPQPTKFCPSTESVCRCSPIPNCKKAAICCNVNNFTLTEGLGCGCMYYFKDLINLCMMYFSQFYEYNYLSNQE